MSIEQKITAIFGMSNEVWTAPCEAVYVCRFIQAAKSLQDIWEYSNCVV